MEHQEQVAIDHDTSNGKSSSYLCRQSSTRWSPTSEQIRILKELYYNNGVRSPSAEQIQRISAKLRQYGKIEGKNVFYWFQNHKARERQKRRFTTHSDIPPAMAIKYHLDHHIISPPPPQHMKFSSNNIPGANSSSPGLPNYGYGSLAMEKSFRECSIGSGSTEHHHHHHHNFAWAGVDPYSSSPYPFLDDPKRKYKTLEMEEQEEEEIETLPLFPMHGDIKETTSSDYNYLNDDVITTSAAASLELTLNSCNAARFPTSS